jgi:hypothetical protein
LCPWIEALEGRSLLSTAAPAIVMDSATTADSRSVAVEYDILNAGLGQPVEFGVYRSADARFDRSDVPVGSTTVTPQQLDDNGRPATTQGRHRLTIALPQGLPPNPEHPFVLVVADPSHVLSVVTENPNTASFRPYLIGVITHGGLQPNSWRRGVPWEVRMANSLQGEGYDAVIAYNWVADSGHAGAAAEQGPRLGRMVLAAASQFPANGPVDVHYIGHSEGAVVNSMAILYVNQHETPQLQAGYLKETMLDPHAANNHAPGGRQYSVTSGDLGTLARLLIDNYQHRAHDPLPVVPANVNEAEVFFQHTPVAEAKGSNHGIYNLWGQVPVKALGGVPVRYYNLTGRGISHGGDFSVPNWYQAHVVPTLADGSSFSSPGLLTGGLEGGGNGSQSNQPTYQGAAEPGATVKLLVAPEGSSDFRTVGRTVADLAGSWAITSRPLSDGIYRVTAEAVAPADPGWPQDVVVTPKASLGTLAVSGLG